jgi:hypothetical protein
MLKWLRSRAGSLLESHPYGYALGVRLVTATDLFLPHEPDYYGFRHLAGDCRTGLFLDLGAIVATPRGGSPSLPWPPGERPGQGGMDVLSPRRSGPEGEGLSEIVHGRTVAKA